jgi:hypothetical protein
MFGTTFDAILLIISTFRTHAAAIGIEEARWTEHTARMGEMSDMQK